LNIYLLPLTKTYGRINYVFISCSEGLQEISFASTLDALLNKRLTNDNSIKYTQTGWSPSGMARVLRVGYINRQQNLRWMVRCSHDSMFAHSSSMFYRCFHSSTSSRYRRNQRASCWFFNVW